MEWQRIDLAAFDSTPTAERNCVLVCEAKRGGSGMQQVWQQALGYVESLKLTACRKILVTEGSRFYLYARNGKQWPESPTGYFNVEKLRERHVAPANTSAVETIVALTPMNLMRS